MPEPKRARLVQFFGILLLFAIALHVASRLLTVSPIALAPAYMFSPLIAGLVVCLRWDIQLTAVGLRTGRLRWIAVAAVSAIPFVGVTLLVAIAVPGISFDPAVDPVPGLHLPPGLLGVAATFGLVLALGSTINALFAFGEEFGWRGYLLWELAPWGFWKASSAIGASWGLWHAPVIIVGYNYPSFPVIGVGMMTIACLAFSPVYTYLVVRARSVFAAALFHGVFNGSAGLVIAYAAGDTPSLEELVASPVGVAGVLVFSVAAVGIAMSGTPELTREFARDGSASVAAVTVDE
jgi:membrane protease YdiL (CAAX protease family)